MVLEKTDAVFDGAVKCKLLEGAVMVLRSVAAAIEECGQGLDAAGGSRFFLVGIQNQRVWRDRAVADFFYHGYDIERALPGIRVLINIILCSHNPQTIRERVISPSLCNGEI